MENKRTGLDAAILFIEYNGYRLASEITNEKLTNFILDVASGLHTLESVQLWIKDHIQVKNGL